jgi:hypothetical protein
MFQFFNNDISGNLDANLMDYTDHLSSWQGSN